MNYIHISLYRHSVYLWILNTRYSKFPLSWLKVAGECLHLYERRLRWWHGCARNFHIDLGINRWMIHSSTTPPVTGEIPSCIMLLDTRMVPVSFWIMETALLRFMAVFTRQRRRHKISPYYGRGCNVSLVKRKQSNKKRDVNRTKLFSML
jgi:hypothetical protein